MTSLPTKKPAPSLGHRATTRVVKKLKPGQHGTVKLTRQHGGALVCVRYRHDEHKIRCYTTVELVVNTAFINPGLFAKASFGIALGRHETSLRHALQAADARWDPIDRLWWVKGTTLQALDLIDRIRAS